MVNSSVYYNNLKRICILLLLGKSYTYLLRLAGHNVAKYLKILLMFGPARSRTPTAQVSPFTSVDVMLVHSQQYWKLSHQASILHLSFHLPLVQFSLCGRVLLSWLSLNLATLLLLPPKKLKLQPSASKHY